MKVEKYYGKGLALYRTNEGCLVWRYKYTFNDVRTSISLGKAELVSEEEAIKRAEQCSIMVETGKNPRDNRDWKKSKQSYAKAYLLESAAKKIVELAELIENLKNLD